MFNFQSGLKSYADTTTRRAKNTIIESQRPMTEENNKAWWRWLWIPCGVAIAAGLAVGGALFFIFETFAGRGIAVLIFMVACLPASALFAFEKSWRRRFVPAALCVGMSLLLLISIVLSAPTGVPDSNSAINQAFLRDTSFPRFSPFNILPEIDQYKLGFIVGPRLGMLQSRKEAKRLSELFLPLYREMEQRAEYRALGSVSRYTLAQLWGGTFDVGHVYHYVPPASASTGAQLPVIIALHGFGGNNKAYLYTWEKFGNRNTYIVLCPSFGFGFWGRGGSDAVERVRQYAIEKLNGDPDRIYLAGYSNGSLGVSRTIAVHPDHYAGAVFISPAIDMSVLDSKQFLDAWGQRPILCVTGGADARISESGVSRNMETLKKSGLRCTYKIFTTEDHFLMFEPDGSCFAEIERWLKAQASSSAH